MRRFIIFILLLTVGLLQTKAEYITVDGTQRMYIVYKPNNLGTNRPLFISCHGANQDVYYMKNTQMRMEPWLTLPSFSSSFRRALTSVGTYRAIATSTLY